MELINQTYEILLESLKIQAQKYKQLIESELDNSIRKDLDSEIKQMFELLSQMSNSSVILSVAEINALKLQFETKLQEFNTLIESQDLTFVKGDTGSQGLQGEKGETGLQGIQGIQGLKGETGSQGIQGEKGEAGSQGLQGEKGEAGSQGIQGLKGDKGEKGDTGLQGIQGLKGEKGLDGTMTFESLSSEQLATLKGDTGSQGIQGLKGDKGDTGSQGLQGLKGEKGDTGATGLPLTYDSLTPAEKQELASLVPTSGGSGSPVITSFMYNKKTSISDINSMSIKTNIKYGESCKIVFSAFLTASLGSLSNVRHFEDIHHINFFNSTQYNTKSVSVSSNFTSNGSSLSYTSDGFLLIDSAFGAWLGNIGISVIRENDESLECTLHEYLPSNKTTLFGTFDLNTYLASQNNGAT